MFRHKWLVLMGLSVIFMLSAPIYAIEERQIFEPSECEFFVPDGFDVDCGYITVPESRDSALADATNDIRLAVALVHSFSDDPLPDPVIYLDGGPGGHSLVYGDFYIESYAPILDSRDLILFDQRGVGFSEPSLSCPQATDLGYEFLDGNLDGEVLSDEALTELSDETYLNCRDTYLNDGVNLYAYTSAENASDVRDIVKTLGYEQVNLFGISYGTRLGLTVMRDHPEIVRSAVLDAVYPTNVDSEEEFATNAYRAFKTLFDACEEDTACNERYPNLEQVFFDMVDKLNANPETVTFYDYYTETDREILIDGHSIMNSLFSLLYSSSLLSQLPSNIYQASNGVYDPFIDDMLYSLYSSQFFSDGMYYMAECYEEVVFNDVEDVESNAENLSQTIKDTFLTGEDYINFCNAWTKDQQADARENEAVISDIPTLLTVGSYDPITPPAWAQLTAETLSNYYYYEFPATGHSAFFGNEACAATIIFSFIDNPTVEPDATCIDEMAPVLFVPPLVTEVTLIPYSNEELGISGVAPEGWEEIDTADFSAYPSVDKPAFVYRLPESIDEYVGRIIFGTSYNYTELPTPTATVEANNLSWEIYYIENPSIELYSVFAFTTSADDVAYVIALVASTPEERDALYEALILPAIEAFEPSN